MSEYAAELQRRAIELWTALTPAQQTNVQAEDYRARIWAAAWRAQSGLALGHLAGRQTARKIARGLTGARKWGIPSVWADRWLA